MFSNSKKVNKHRCSLTKTTHLLTGAAAKQSTSNLKETAEKMKFSIKDFFSKCDQIRSFHLAHLCAGMGAKELSVSIKDFVIKDFVIKDFTITFAGVQNEKHS